MRQPLEDGCVTIARAAVSVSFPSRFMLAAAMNPCPCGFFGDATRECHCSPPQIQRYVSKISGPLLDRIDIHIEVPAVKYKELRGDAEIESSAERSRTRSARAKNSARSLQGRKKSLRQRPDASQADPQALRDFIRRRDASSKPRSSASAFPPAPTTASSKSPAPSPIWNPRPRSNPSTSAKPSSTAPSIAITGPSALRIAGLLCLRGVRRLAAMLPPGLPGRAPWVNLGTPISRLRSDALFPSSRIVPSPFQRQQARFRLKPARKSCQFAGGTDDAVARRDNGNGIFPVGRAHGAHCFGVFDLFRNLPVTRGFPERNRQQRRPNLLLKFGSLEIEFQRKRFSLSGKIIVQLAFGFEKHGMIFVF